MTSGPRIKIGVLSFAHTHAQSYLALLGDREDVEVHAWDAGGDEPGRGEEAALVGGARWAPSVEELLGRGLDGVIVCSENVHHRRDVEAALAAGAHVLCEKPLATGVADAAALVAAADRARRRLMIAHPVRFSTAFTALREAVGRGDLGELLAVTGTNNGRLPQGRAWFTDPSASGGGAITDHTVHVTDLLDDLLSGDRPVSVYATANRLLHPELAVETAGLVQVTYASGLVATIDCSWSRPDDYPTWGGLTLDLLGAGGVAQLDAFAQRVDGHLAGRGRAWLPYGENADGALIEAFLTSIRTGEPVAPDARAGLRGVAIVQAAYASVRSGRREPVELPRV